MPEQTTANNSAEQSQDAAAGAAGSASAQQGSEVAAAAKDAQATAAPKQRKPQAARRKSAKKERLVFVSGKRKEARARAAVKKGTGRITINSVDINLFEPKELRRLMMEPLSVSNIAKEISRSIDINVNVSGGGRSAQAQAVRCAIARGIVGYSESDTIKKEYIRYDRSLLVEDPRRVEPKKFKGPKARARFQTSYR
ncbi:MAG: 30S ribosomal protein S9 [Candidatus Micrarchaeaceae archaeon]